MAIDKSLKILVVDDSIGIRLAAKKIFKNLGYTDITIVDDGTTALEKLKEEPYELVVADWNMPKMSGMELLKEMKKDPSLKNIPFLLVTGDENQDNLMSAIQEGISNFMPKPYNAKVLESKINRIFDFKNELVQREKHSIDGSDSTLPKSKKHVSLLS